MDENSIPELIEDALKNVGIDEGDTIFVHSDSTAIRNLTHLGWLEALEILKNCFLNVLGNKGTLIVPTFNWDFCKGKKYNHQTTRSKVGMFTGYVLSDKRAIRSTHPIYSFAGIGPDVDKLFNEISNSSFGENSVFHRLHRIDAKVVFFNTSFNECTFVHYVEQKIGVDYRFLKQFEGTVVNNGHETTGTYDFYARYLEKNIEPRFEKLRTDLLSSHKMVEAFLCEQYSISQVSCADIYAVAQQGLNSDPWYLIKQPNNEQHL